MSVYRNHSHLFIEYAWPASRRNHTRLMTAEVKWLTLHSLKEWGLIIVRPFLHRLHFQGYHAALLVPVGKPESVAGQALSVQGKLLVIMAWQIGFQAVLCHQRHDQGQVFDACSFPIPELCQGAVVVPRLGFSDAMLGVHIHQVGLAVAQTETDGRDHGRRWY